MAKLDYERMRSLDRVKGERPEQPVGAVVRPARSGKQYGTLREAQNAARYVNDWGQQRKLYEWFPRPTPDGLMFELWRRPRRQPMR